MFSTHSDFFKASYDELLYPLAVVKEKSLTLCFVNPAFAGLDALSPSVGENASNVFFADSGTQVNQQALLNACHKKEKIFSQWHCKSGRQIAFHVSSITLDAESYFIFQLDQRTQKSVQQSEEAARLAYAMGNACDGLWDWDVITNDVYFSPRLDQLLGFQPGERDPELYGWFDLVHPDDQDRVMAALKQHIEGKASSYEEEYRILTRQGVWKIVRDKGQACRWDEQGKATRLVGMLLDITPYKELENRLREALKKFEDFSSCCSDWYWETNNALTICSIKSKSASEDDIYLQQLEGLDLISLLKAHQHEEAARDVRDGKPLRNIRVKLSSQGYWVNLSGVPVTDCDGNIIGYRGVGVNIKEQVALENMVLNYRKNGVLMMESAPAAIGLVDSRGQFFYANDTFLKLVKADNDTLTENYLSFHNLSRPDLELFSHKADGQNISYELVQESLEETRFYSVLKYLIYEAEDKTPLVVNVVLDITSSRQQEVEQKKTQMVLDNIAEGILITNADHKIITANKSLLKVTGFSLDELKGNTPSVLSSGRNDDHYYQEMWYQVHQSGKWRGYIWNRCRNGTLIRQHVSIQAIMLNKEVQHYIGIYSSIYQSGEQRDYELFAEQYDPLTALPNRQLFQDRLHMACQRGRRHRQPVELTLLTISNMTDIRKKCGHVAGDDILKKLAFQLQEVLSLDDTAARFSSEQFVIIRERDISIPTEELIRPLLDQVIVLGDGVKVNPVYNTYSVRYPDHGLSPKKLIHNLQSHQPPVNSA